MNYWQIIKDKFEDVKPIYDKAARGFLLGNLLLYAACCIVANGPVGPVNYVAFLYHCCQWKVTHG
jgi:hypothetical protein